jgi:hypothetical protein
LPINNTHSLDTYPGLKLGFSRYVAGSAKLGDHDGEKEAGHAKKA